MQEIDQTGYGLLLQLQAEAKRRKTVISISCLYGVDWVVTETNQETRIPRQCGDAAHSLYDALANGVAFFSDITGELVAK